MRTRTTTLLATLLAVGLMPIAATAQDQGNNRPTPRQTIRNTNPEDTYEGAPDARRSGQGTLTQQRTQGTTQVQPQQGQLQGTRIDGQQGQQSQQGMEEQLSMMVGAKMAIKNNCEIKTAQMAMEKINHPEVKQFAQMMVRDHQQLNQQLMQAMPQLQSVVDMKSSDRTSSTDSNQQSQTAQSDRGIDRGTQPSPDLQNRDSRQAATPGQPGAADQREGQLSPSATERATGYRGTAGQGSMNALQQKMVSICQETADNSLEMTKQEFSEKEGNEKELAMCYMGTQLVVHQQTLAELKALQGEGTQEFQQIVQQAQDKVSQHLNQAKSIVETLSSDQSSGQSRSSGQSGQTRPQGQSGQNN
jgi:predicted outer membrane protein